MKWQSLILQRDTHSLWHSFLSDGKLLITGGQEINNRTPDFMGINKAAVFDYTNNQFTQLPEMNGKRWYPTNITLSNGNALVWAGVSENQQINNVPQILERQSDGTFSWRSARITNPETYNIYYSWLHLLSSGKVFVGVGYQAKSYLLSLGDRFRYPRDYFSDGQNMTDPHEAGSSVVYDKDKILVVGGASLPKATAEIINLNSANPQWSRVGRLTTGRRHMDATLLPDGKVLATGGNKGDGFNNSCPQNFVKEAELWDPNNPGIEPGIGWTQLASATQPRLYHSSAVLLPDGRVLTGGTTTQQKEGHSFYPDGPLCSDETPTVHTIEAFSPPYLFNPDGTPAARPEISNAPAQVSYGQTIQFTVSGAGAGSKVNLIRLPSVTHSFNQNQGINKLTPTISGQTFSVTVPANRNECPPGHYMMFVINSAGVPSKAKIIQVL